MAGLPRRNPSGSKVAATCSPKSAILWHTAAAERLLDEERDRSGVIHSGHGSKPNETASVLIVESISSPNLNDGRLEFTAKLATRYGPRKRLPRRLLPVMRDRVRPRASPSLTRIQYARHGSAGWMFLWFPVELKERDPGFDCR